MLKHLRWVVVLMLVWGSFATAQTRPTPAEQDAWARDPNATMLETTPCKKITWLIENGLKRPPTQRPFRSALGWWGRGFLEGAVYVMGDKASKTAGASGLSAEVVATNIVTYCYGHPADTPVAAVQDLLLRILKKAT